MKLAVTTGLILLGALVVTAARIEGFMGRAVARAEAQEINMGSITFSRTIDGTTYTRTYHQQPGESDADFEARALRLWNEFLARIGS
jgi:hypothetical protein